MRARIATWRQGRCRSHLSGFQHGPAGRDGHRQYRLRRSAEHPHRALLAHLGVEALLTLDMRLGEGTGAAMALPLVRSAIALLSTTPFRADGGGRRTAA